MANKYNIGTLVQLNVEFQNASGVDTDPGAVVATVKDPSGAESTPTPVKDSTGKYHITFLTALAGVHYYGFSGSGGLTVAGQSAFVVVPNQY